MLGIYINEDECLNYISSFSIYITKTYNMGLYTFEGIAFLLIYHCDYFLFPCHSLVFLGCVSVQVLSIAHFVKQ